MYKGPRKNCVGQARIIRTILYMSSYATVSPSPSDQKARLIKPLIFLDDGKWVIKRHVDYKTP